MNMGLFKNFVSQTRKPTGFLGKVMLSGMNSGHGKMADWGMSNLNINNPNYIAELGCGGGRNAAELLRQYSKAKVWAVDYSPLSVQKATEYNRKAITDGRCKVMQGDVSNLSLPKEKFDLATAFETAYFWGNLNKCFAEVFSILNSGGCFMIVNESDGTDAAGKKYEKIIAGMRVYTAKEIEEALANAGFTEIQTVHHEQKPWITVIAKKGI